MSKFSAILLSLLLFTSGCVVRKYHTNPAKYELEDISEKFFLNRGMWWNYYQRGLGFMEKGKWDCAIIALEEARNMFDKDQRSVRTYGMHRIDCFVNRELGIAYYENGNMSKNRDDSKEKKDDCKESVDESKDDCTNEKDYYDKAKCYLEKSLETIDSARARFYIRELVRKKSKKEGQESVPEIKINSLKKSETNGSIIELDITTNDENGIDYILINGIPMGLFVYKTKFDLKKRIRLKPGENSIRIEAINLLGVKGTKTVNSDTFDKKGAKKTENGHKLRLNSQEYNKSESHLLFASINNSIFTEKLARLNNSNENNGNSEPKENECMKPSMLVEEFIEPENRYKIFIYPFKWSHSHTHAVDYNDKKEYPIQSLVFDAFSRLFTEYKYQETVKEILALPKETKLEDIPRRFNKTEEKYRNYFFDNEGKLKEKKWKWDITEIKKEIKDIYNNKKIDFDGILTGELFYYPEIKIFSHIDINSYKKEELHKKYNELSRTDKNKKSEIKEEIHKILNDLYKKSEVPNVYFNGSDLDKIIDENKDKRENSFYDIESFINLKNNNNAKEEIKLKTFKIKINLYDFTKNKRRILGDDQKGEIAVYGITALVRPSKLFIERLVERLALLLSTKYPFTIGFLKPTSEHGKIIVGAKKSDPTDNRYNADLGKEANAIPYMKSFLYRKEELISSVEARTIKNKESSVIVEIITREKLSDNDEQNLKNLEECDLIITK